jgi:hypothetical protein
MANKTLSDLAQATEVQNTDLLHIRQDLIDKKVSLELLAAHILQNSGLGFSTETIAVNTIVAALTEQHKTFWIDTSTGNISLTLPVDGGGAELGSLVCVINIGSNNATIVYKPGINIVLPADGCALLQLRPTTNWDLLFNSTFQVLTNYLQLGAAGPKLKSNANGLIVRNNTDDAYDDFRAKSFALSQLTNILEEDSAGNFAVKSLLATLLLCGKEASQMTANCVYDGSGWNRINVAAPAFRLVVDDANGLSVYKASAGENPIASWDLLNNIPVFLANGSVSMSGTFNPVRAAALATPGIMAPPGSDYCNDIIMDFSDALAFIKNRKNATITVTGVSEEQAGKLTLDAGVGFITFNSGTSPYPITLEINTSTNPINVNNTEYFLPAFVFRSVPPGLTNIEVWVDVGSGYVQKRNVNVTPAAFINLGRFGTSAPYTIQKIKYVLNGTNPLSAPLYLSRALLYHPQTHAVENFSPNWRVFVEQHFPDGGHKFVNGDALKDDSGNELIKFEKKTNAVNEVTVFNETAQSGPGFKVTGNDNNIDFNLASKGTGKLKFNNVIVPTNTELTKEHNADGTHNRPHRVIYQGGYNAGLTYSQYFASLNAILPSTAIEAFLCNGFFNGVDQPIVNIVRNSPTSISIRIINPISGYSQLVEFHNGDDTVVTNNSYITF